MEEKWVKLLPVWSLEALLGKIIQVKVFWSIEAMLGRKIVAKGRAWPECRLRLIQIYPFFPVLRQMSELDLFQLLHRLCGTHSLLVLSM